jgi:hypothetical protein
MPLGRGIRTRAWFWVEGQLQVPLETRAMYTKFELPTRPKILVPADERDAPDHVLTALAEWRLTHG